MKLARALLLCAAVIGAASGGPVPARAPNETPIGYELMFGEDPISRVLYPSPAAACTAAYGNSARLCGLSEQGVHQCGPVCQEGQMTGIYEVCTGWPIQPPPRFMSIKGKFYYSHSLGKCVCHDSLGRPALKLRQYQQTGYCTDPPSIDFQASQTEYLHSAPDEPVWIDLHSYIGGLPRGGVGISMGVTSADGAPGEVTPASVITDSEGRARVRYTFPDFARAKKDTVVITCSDCAEGVSGGTIEIKMAPVVVGFFNGVWNTERQANDGLRRLRGEMDTLRGQQSFAYELFYNQSGCGRSGTTCLQDIAEVFAQRAQELDGFMASRWEHFWDLLMGRHTSPQSSTEGLLGLLGPVALALAQSLDATFNAMLGQIAAGWSLLLSSPPTVADVAAHLAKLQRHVDQGSPLLLVAHSQGNLFVNAAYDGVRAARPQMKASVVHIAPASPTLRGAYTLADIDLVINGLRIQGITSVPPANAALPYSKADASGHTLVGTYLDASRGALERVKALLQQALLAF